MTNNCLQCILCPSKFYEQTERSTVHLALAHFFKNSITSTPPFVLLDEVIAEDFTIVREQHTRTIMCVR